MLWHDSYLFLYPPTPHFTSTGRWYVISPKHWRMWREPAHLSASQCAARGTLIFLTCSTWSWCSIKGILWGRKRGILSYLLLSVEFGIEGENYSQKCNHSFSTYIKSLECIFCRCKARNVRLKTSSCVTVYLKLFWRYCISKTGARNELYKTMTTEIRYLES